MSNNKIIDINNKKYWGFALDNIYDPISFRKLINLKQSAGYIVENDNIETWNFTGIHSDDINYIYGPFFEGISLDEVISLPADQSIIYLQNLIKALYSVEKKIGTNFLIQLDSVYFFKDKVLFLPFEIMEHIREVSNEKYRLNNFDIINHPYISPEKNHSFNIAVLFYKIITGKFPYQGNNEEEIFERIRNQKIIPANFINLDINLEISNFLDKFFNKSNYILLEEWNKKKIDWRGKCLFINISDEVKNKKQQVIEKTSIDIEKKYKQKVFLEKNKTKIIIAVIIFVGISIILGSVFGNITKPKSTKGLLPELVIEIFYKSINKLDHLTMSECVEKNAGKNIINEVMSLYVISRQNMAYTQKSNIVFADEWVKSGMKKVESSKYIYGIFNLKIMEEKPIPEPVYIVKYEKWEPFSDDKDIGIQNKLYSVTEKVFLHYKNKYWTIYKIERFENLENTNR